MDQESENWGNTEPNGTHFSLHLDPDVNREAHLILCNRSLNAGKTLHNVENHFRNLVDPDQKLITGVLIRGQSWHRTSAKDPTPSGRTPVPSCAV